MLKMRAWFIALSWCLWPIALGWAVPVQAANAASFGEAINAAHEMMVEYPERAVTAGERASRSATTDEQRATALWIRAEALLRSRDPEGGNLLIRQATDIAGRLTGNPGLHGNILLTRGAIEVELAQIAVAVEHYQRAYRLFRQAGDGRKQAITLLALAELYRQGADFESALRYYQRALETYDGDAVFTVSLLNNRGVLLQEMGRPQAAIAELTTALDATQRTSSVYWRTMVLNNLARSQIALGALDDAEKTVAQGFALADQPGGEGALDNLRVVAASLALERGQIAKARNLIEMRFDRVDLDQTTLGARPAHLTAYTVYDRFGLPALALRHLAALRRLDDQANRIATSTRAALMSVRFDFANQELRIANLKAEELRRNVAFERSRTRFQQTLFALAALGTLLVLALLGYNLYLTRRSRNVIRAANTELAATNIRLEKALAAKTEFLATTSHEIRTPLNGILGMTQVMLADGSLSGKLRDRVGIVHGAGLTMKALVDDILDVAKMETGHLSVSLEPTDLPATLAEVTRMWEEQAHAKGLAFVLDVAQAPRWIETDPGRLRQIIFNLLANALKFTESGGITLRVTTSDGTGGGEGDATRLKIAVRDTGIGIPEEKQGDIFESFKQVDSGTTRKFGGTGLGLAICRSLARALGGDVAVDSVVDEGATFTIDLPLRPAAAPDGDETGMDGTALLIFDRNPINRSMLRTLLEPRIGSVRFADSVEQAVKMLSGGGISHVLIDDGSVRGGEGDPIALVGKVSAAAAGVGARSAILWKTPDDQDLARLRETALDAVIVKPVSGIGIADALFGANGNPPLVSQAA